MVLLALSMALAIAGATALVMDGLVPARPRVLPQFLPQFPSASIPNGPNPALNPSEAM